MVFCLLRVNEAGHIYDLGRFDERSDAEMTKLFLQTFNPMGFYEVHEIDDRRGIESIGAKAGNGHLS